MRLIMQYIVIDPTYAFKRYLLNDKINFCGNNLIPIVHVI